MERTGRHRKIRIAAGPVTALADLNDSATADAIWQALPISARANTWGDEVYFAIPVDEELEDAQELVNAGDLGYWPTGKAFCIFFGPTPVSRGNEIRPASAVNVFGRLIGDPGAFRAVKAGDRVTLDKA